MAVSTIDPNGLNIGQIGGTRNKLINGAMVIDQRNGGSSVTPTTKTFTVDRWAAVESTDGSMTVQQSSVAPAGFINSLLTTVTSADTSLGATQYATLIQTIEGYNIADLSWGSADAKTITLSFWVRSSVTGTFGGALQNSAQNRSYPFSYTISSANTFEYKTITIPGDTSGTWATTNGAGVSVWFNFAAGSTYTGTAATWAGALYMAPTGATNLLATNGATFYLTGVQLEVGDTATPFEHRSYGQELALCQRYFETSYDVAVGSATDNGAISLIPNLNNARYTSGFSWKVTKRATPTVTLYDWDTGTSGQVNLWSTGAGISVTGIFDVNTNGWRYTDLGTSYASNAFSCHFTASAEL